MLNYKFISFCFLFEIQLLTVVRRYDTVTEQQCSTITEKQCTPVTAQDCRNIPDTQCRTENVQKTQTKCAVVNKQQCADVKETVIDTQVRVCLFSLLLSFPVVVFSHLDEKKTQNNKISQTIYYLFSCG
jgi:hypothetical protein